MSLATPDYIEELALIRISQMQRETILADRWSGLDLSDFGITDPGVQRDFVTGVARAAEERPTTSTPNEERAA